MMNSQSLMAECMAANVRSLLYMKALKPMKASNEEKYFSQMWLGSE